MKTIVGKETDGTYIKYRHPRLKCWVVETEFETKYATDDEIDEVVGSINKNVLIDLDKAIKEVTGFTIEELGTPGRWADKNEARQIAFFFYYRLGWFLIRIADRFNRNYSTVLHGKNKIAQLYGMKGEEKLTDKVNKISKLTGIKVRGSK